MTEIDAAFLDDCIAQAKLFRDLSAKDKDILMYSYYNGHYDALTKIRSNCVDSIKEGSK